MSKNMCAGTVVDPPGATSAAIVSVTSISRSVAFNESLERSPCKSTLARIGIVLRRSTTRWTWPSDFNSAARSTVTFMSTPLVGEPDRFKGQSRWRAEADFARVGRVGKPPYPTASDAGIRQRPRGRVGLRGPREDLGRQPRRRPGWLVQRGLTPAIAA